MLAKVIVHAATRAAAIRLLSATLRRARLHGVVTNRDLLVRVLDSAEFLDGGTDTAFLARHPEVFESLLSDVDDRELTVLAAALAAAAGRQRRAAWGALPSGWRNVPSTPQRVRFAAPWGDAEVAYRLDRDGRLLDDRTRILSAAPDRVVLEVGGLTRTFAVHAIADHSYVDGDGGSADLRELPRLPDPVVERPAGSLIAPMPGAVGRVRVSIGQAVAAGELLLTLEAMKMEHPVHAPEPGVVTELRVAPGAQVEAGTILAVVATEGDQP
jgi:propionyl-CoA carboxylase alpha chain